MLFHREIIFCILLCICACNSVKNESNLTNNRNSKFWEIGLVRFKNDHCLSLDGFYGTCYTRHQCQNLGGKGSGTCASNLGTCCSFVKTCGQSSSQNCTYFVNPGYPASNVGTSACTFIIQKCNSGICQIRLDFLNLKLAQPDGNGNCVTDSFIVTGAASNIPPICGDNTGQHMYFNFFGDSDIKLTINVGALTGIDRYWNIKIMQLGCNCPTLAPNGCLMYSTALEGTIKSFNYGTTINPNLITTVNGVRPGTREMTRLNYGVCVEMQPGYCSIEWTQGPDPTSFTVSNNTALDNVDPGLPSNPLNDGSCLTDFVVIPNPRYVNGSKVNSDRFCGDQLIPVRSSSKPFVLTVVTNSNEMNGADVNATLYVNADIANRGFSLLYKQIPCTQTINNIYI